MRIVRAARKKGPASGTGRDVRTFKVFGRVKLADPIEESRWET